MHPISQAQIAQILRPGGSAQSAEVSVPGTCFTLEQIIKPRMASERAAAATIRIDTVPITLPQPVALP